MKQGKRRRDRDLPSHGPDDKFKDNTLLEDKDCKTSINAASRKAYIVDMGACDHAKMTWTIKKAVCGQ